MGQGASGSAGVKAGFREAVSEEQHLAGRGGRCMTSQRDVSRAGRLSTNVEQAKEAGRIVLVSRGFAVLGDTDSLR